MAKESNETIAPGDEVRSSSKVSSNVPATTDAIIPKTVSWSESKWKVHREAVIFRKAGPQRSKVAAFDMDGTLLVWRTTGWPSKITDYELWNAAVITRFRRLYDEEQCQLVIISNQGGMYACPQR